MNQPYRDLIVEGGPKHDEMRLGAPHGAVTEIRFRDHRLVDAAHLTQVGQQLLSIAADAPQKSRFVLSFEGVEAMSSAALGIIIAFDDEVRRKYGVLHLSDLKDDLLKLFTLTKLNKRLHIYASADEARAEFT